MTYAIYNEKELFDPIKLCDSDGCLSNAAIGWSRKPIFDCNLTRRWMRKKKWNYWAVTSDDCLFSVTVTNLDYAGMVFMYYYDFHTKAFIEKTFLTPMGKGCTLNEGVFSDVYFSNSKVMVSMVKKGTHTQISVKCKNFDGKYLEADLLVLYPDHYDTLNVVIPWNKRTFQFTSKHEGMSVQGTLKVGSSLYSFSPESAFGCLDFGRGIWPRKISWNWANVSGITGGRRIGINLGAKWTDNTGMTENAIVVDGRLEKISEDVIFGYDRNDYRKDWRIRTALTDKVDLVFHPDYERIAQTNMVLVKSELHQIIGHVTGTIRYGNEDIIEIKNLIGCTEDHFTLW